MELDILTAISPIDGRYRGKAGALASYFSEFALIKYRESLGLLRRQQPDQQKEGAEEVARHDQRTAAGEFPDLADDGKGDKGTGRDGVEQDAVFFSVHHIEQAGKGGAGKHQKADR